MKTFILLLFLITSITIAKGQEGLSKRDIENLIPILKDDPSLFCEQILDYKINFFPTKEVINKFRQLGMTPQMVECIQNNFTSGLNFQVFQLKCILDYCDTLALQNFSREILESIFTAKRLEREIFAAKSIVDSVYQDVLIPETQLPAIYLTGRIRQTETKMYVSMSLKYQNKFSSGGQLISTSDFFINSLSQPEQRSVSDKIAKWCLDEIKSEIFYSIRFE